MNKLKEFQYFGWLLALGLAAMTGCAGKTTQEEQAVVPQQMFASPGEATAALIAAAEAGDRTAMERIFGPHVHGFLTGDKVLDKMHFRRFALNLKSACVQVPEGNDKIVLDIGEDGWPFPIPLVREHGQWYFDTDAGAEEIINRRVGRDELHAVGVCRTYVAAQRQYFSKARDGSGVQKYALKFKSTSGKQDGLYWTSGEEPSPFGALVAEAHAEGYGKSPGTGPYPFHGYLFKILTRQGPAAPGGEKDYMGKGNLTGGFALVAYPVRWGISGIMTFIVNQEGLVYQQDLGKESAKVAAAMTEYNPDSKWTLVQEAGFSTP